MSVPEIIPAIMPDNIEDLRLKLALVVPYSKRVQLDIMDGIFVPEQTWPYIDSASFKKILTEDEGMPFWDKLDFEVDLMVLNPEEVINNWIQAGASRIIVHIESTKKMSEIIRDIEQQFSKPIDKGSRLIELGIALNIDTPLELVTTYLEDIDFIQFMGIDHIGYQGESFDTRVIDKIRVLREGHPEVIISVDGGVNLDTAEALIKAGATRLVSGSAIFESQDIKQRIAEFKHLFL